MKGWEEVGQTMNFHDTFLWVFKAFRNIQKSTLLRKQDTCKAIYIFTWSVQTILSSVIRMRCVKPNCPHQTTSVSWKDPHHENLLDKVWKILLQQGEVIWNKSCIMQFTGRIQLLIINSKCHRHTDVCARNFFWSWEL